MYIVVIYILGYQPDMADTSIRSHKFALHVGESHVPGKLFEFMLEKVGVEDILIDETGHMIVTEDYNYHEIFIPAVPILYTNSGDTSIGM